MAVDPAAAVDLRAELLATLPVLSPEWTRASAHAVEHRYGAPDVCAGCVTTPATPADDCPTITALHAAYCGGAE